MAWYLARSLDTLRSEIHQVYPATTIWTIGDAAHATRNSDHNPHPTTGVVCAIDVVGTVVAQAVANHIVATRDPRVKYIIWNRRIMSSTIQPWTWRPYGGGNPHTSHIHISVGRGPGGHSTHPNLYDDPSRWGFAPTRTPPTSGGISLFPRHGDRSDDATAYIQRCLDRLGYTVTVDGHYGDETAAAVAQFFKDRTGQDTNGKAVQSNQLLHLHRALFETPAAPPLSAQQRAGIDHALAHKARLDGLGSSLAYLDVVVKKNRDGGLLSRDDGDARYARRGATTGGLTEADADARYVRRGTAVTLP